jgi:hypothetical protein
MRSAVNSLVETLEGRVLLSVSTAINHSTGFATATDMQLNGTSTIPGANGTSLQLLDYGGSEAASAFDTTVQGIDTFDTKFNFDFSGMNPDADGFTFTLQNSPAGATAIGAGGGGIGYVGIPNSIAVKFDMWDSNNAAALGGPKPSNNTYTASGVYLNGDPLTDDPRQAISTTPAPLETSVDFSRNPDLTTTGIDFHANPNTDQYTVELKYDGTTLSETLTDVTLAKSATQTYTINLPQVLGAHTAFAGFTAGDGGAFSETQIDTWTYAGTASTQLPTPVLTGKQGVGSEALLSWTQALGAGGTKPVSYVVDSSTDGGATFTQLTTLPGTATSYDATGLDPTKTYQFKIQAKGDTVNSLDSNFSNVVTVNAAGAAPLLGGFAALPGQADLTYSDVGTTQVGYQLVASTDGGATFSNFATFNPGTSHYLFTGLDPTKTYQFKLEALGNGTTTTNTPFSNVISINEAGPTSPSVADFSGGFTNSGQIRLNGVATLTGPSGTPANALELTHGVNGGEAGSGFDIAPVGVDTFDTTYQFTYGTAHAPNADGFVFTLQNAPAGAAALGGSGGSMGYDGIQNSFGVYVNLYNNVDQTGSAQDGTRNAPIDVTVDPVSGNPTGIDFHAHPGDTYQMHLTYDGTTVTETLTDQTLLAAGMPGTFTTTYSVDIPTAVGAHTAFAGFTGADGGALSQQDVLNWKYTGTFPPVTLPAPVAVATSCAVGTVDVGWTDVLPSSGFQVLESTDGGTTYSQVGSNLPAVQNQLEIPNLDPTKMYTFEVVALPIGNVPKLTSNAVTAQPLAAAPAPVNYGSGFTTTDGTTISGLMLNGSAAPTGTGTPGNALQITSNAAGLAGSAFTTVAQPTSGFDTGFDFTYPIGSAPPADGFAFVLQNSPSGPSALGPTGGGLGYGPVGNASLNAGGIPNSVAIKFDLYQNDNEGTNSTGLFTNGDAPSTAVLASGPEASVDMTPSGVVLGTTDTYHAQLTYDGTTLHEVVTDKTTGKTFTHDYTINLSQYLKGDCAYVGFTGGTGGLTAEQDILNWTYTPVAVSNAAHLVSTGFGNGTTLSGTQRSEVRDISLKFDHAVTLGAGAITLVSYAGNDTTGAQTDASAALGTPTTTDGGLTWTIPVLANTAFSDATGSLKDGIYTVTVNPAKVTGGTLSGTNLSTTFHRLYGDIDGNKTVNSADYFKFKAAFGSTTGQANFNADFDFDGNGKINSSDYFKFKTNFGRKFTY